MARRGGTDMIESSLEPRMAKRKIDPFTQTKDIWHITYFFRGFDIVDGYITLPLNELYFPNNSIFGSQ